MGFTKEGRRIASLPCPVSAGGAHEPDPTQAQLGTFYCRLCGAIPRDSVWHDAEGDADGQARG